MGALTLIQSGFFSAATSGRWAFSGWRGLLVASSTTVMAAPRLTYGRRAAGARRPLLASACRIAGRPGTTAPAPVEFGIFRTNRIAPIATLLSLHLEEDARVHQAQSNLQAPHERTAGDGLRGLNRCQENIALVWPQAYRSFARYDGRAR